MNKKKFTKIALIVLIVFLAGLVGYFVFSTGNPLRVCPDEWYVNRMPSIGRNNTSNEYFSYKGERRELSEFDVDWVKTNCSIEPQILY